MEVTFIDPFIDPFIDVGRSTRSTPKRTGPGKDPLTLQELVQQEKVLNPSGCS